MRIKIILLLLLTFTPVAFSQQIEMFGTGIAGYGYFAPPVNSSETGTKIKYDIQGRPVIVSIGVDGRLYILKSQNGKFLAPVPLVALPNPIYIWDFDIDANGVVHIAGFFSNSQRAFYINSIDRVIQIVADDSSTQNSFSHYVRVLRTADNQLYINYSYLFSQSLVWIQLINPTSSNLNKVVKNIDLSYYENNYRSRIYIFTANKNLYLNVLLGYWIYVSIPPIWGPDTFYAAYTTIKINNSGTLEYLSGSNQVQVSTDNNVLPVPLIIADNNLGYITWLFGKIRMNVFYTSPNALQLFKLRALYLDNSNNLHLLKSINNQLFYSVYTPNNLPINAPGSTPYREILIPENKITYRSYPAWNYSTDAVSFTVLDFNTAYVLFPELNELNSTKMLNLGSSLLKIQNGNISTEFIISTGNYELPAYNRWLQRNGKNYIVKFSQYDSVDVQTGRFYLFQTIYENGKAISSIDENEIVNLDFPQINPKLKPQTFKTDKNGLIYIVSLTRDTVRYIAGREEYGRYYLTKEVAPGNWTQQFIAHDTVAYNYNKHDLDIDDNGVVHFVYGYGYKVYYTNNSNGSFKTPIIIDSLSSSAGFFPLVSVRAVSTDTVYILCKTGYGTYSLYYGNYNSSFIKAQTSFTGTYMPILEVDKNNNAFVFYRDYTYNNGNYEYYYFKFHFNPTSSRRTLLSFPAMSQNVFSIDVSRDKNGLVHLIAGYSGIPKVFYGNSTNDFSSLVEYNLLNFEAYNYFNKTSYTGPIRILPVSDESKVYFTMLAGGGNEEIFPSVLGWVPYNLTSVDYSQNIIPDNFKLYQNYPNPFNPTTRFKFSLPERSQVKIEIYNLLGELVYQFPERVFESGIYEEEWNGIDNQNKKVASGIYILKLNAKSNHNKIFSDTKKMILMK